jgi:hypothetical protein
MPNVFSHYSFFSYNVKKTWRKSMNTCIASISSLNLSIKAQKALAQEKIYCKIISLDPSLTKRGCAYGIEFSCSEERNVRTVLRRAGIYPSQFIKKQL